MTGAWLIIATWQLMSSRSEWRTGQEVADMSPR